MEQDGWQIDPALVELYKEGAGDDEVSVILRLHDGGRVPDGVRVVSAFGQPRPRIVTARCMRYDIGRIHDSPLVASMKAPRVVWNEELWECDGYEAGAQEFPADSPSLAEDGTGVTMGLIDYGFDFTHPNFRNADGSTRLEALWDQGAEEGSGAQPWGYGRVFSRAEIDASLATSDPFATLGYNPARSDARRTGTHGTHVADIAAGNRREPGSTVGLARNSPILFVDLAAQKLPEPANFGDSVRLLEALDFLRRHAGNDGRLVINLSAGMTGGPHDFTTLFTQAVDAMLLERPGIALVQSTGNYAASRLHTDGRVGPEQRRVLHWLISPRDRTANELEIWYPGHDRFGVTLIAPSGERFSAELGEMVHIARGTESWGSFYHRKHEPNSGKNHVDIILSPRWPGGRTRVEIFGRDVVNGEFHAWIERDGRGPRQSRFPGWQARSHYTTNTICNSYRGIAVGAVTEQRRPTPFSSRGPTADGRQKPELVAPGYRIRAARSMPFEGWRGESRFTEKSGTSMASPAVAGTVALMMQAARRSLTVTEVRHLLIGAVDPVPGRPARGSTRLGYGFLNIEAAVEAARRVGAGEAVAEIVGGEVCAEQLAPTGESATSQLPLDPLSGAEATEATGRSSEILSAVIIEEEPARCAIFENHPAVTRREELTGAPGEGEATALWSETGEEFEDEVFGEATAERSGMSTLDGRWRDDRPAVPAAPADEAAPEDEVAALETGSGDEEDAADDEAQEAQRLSELFDALIAEGDEDGMM